MTYVYVGFEFWLKTLKDPGVPERRGLGGRRRDECHLLNNAFVQDFEASEDPEWDKRVMVVATSSKMTPSPNQHLPVTPHHTVKRSESFTRSLERMYKGQLHKEVLIAAVNMSRKSSSDEADTPANNPFRRSRSRIFYDSHRTNQSPAFQLNHPLPPDSFYPKDTRTVSGQQFTPSIFRNTPSGASQGSHSKERKDSKILNTVNSGWHSCFKNNNYIFVRNCRGDFSSVTSDDQETWYRNYNLAEKKITMISPSCYAGQKLRVVMQPEEKDIPKNENSIQDDSKNDATTNLSKLTVISTKKKNASSLMSNECEKKINGKPNQGSTTSHHLEENKPLLLATSQKDRENGQCTTPKQKDSCEREVLKVSQKKFASGWLQKLKTPCRKKHNLKSATHCTPIIRNQTGDVSWHGMDLNGSTETPKVSGPHTSTPKDPACSRNVDQLKNSSTYNSLPYRGRHSGTPRKAEKKNGVRRKLPYAAANGSVSPENKKVTGLDHSNISSPLPIGELDLIDENARRTTMAKRIDVTSGSQNGETPGLVCDREDLSGVSEMVDHEENKMKKFDRNPETSLSLQSIVALSPIPSTLTDITKDSTVPAESKMEQDENVSFFNQEPSFSSAWNSEPEDRDGKADAPVSSWLKELRVSTENECFNALQGKTLTKDKVLFHALRVGIAQERAEIMRERRSYILSHLIVVQKAIHVSDWKCFQESGKELCSTVSEFFERLNNEYSKIDKEHDFSQEKVNTEKVDKLCNHLMKDINSEDDLKSWTEDQKILAISSLNSLKQELISTFDYLVIRELNVIVGILEEPENSNCAKRAIFAIILLGQLGQALCKLLSKTGVVRALLCVCIDSKLRHLHASALRALTVLCCVPAAVKSLEKEGGVECISDVLCDPEATEKSRSEAAGLIAQITAPWMESSGFVLREIKENGNKLVQALTDLGAKTECSQVFLLSSAALANLSFIESAVGDWMKKYETANVLVAACKNLSIAQSLFIKDQVATVLANMASSASYQELMMSSGALALLLDFLQLRPTSVYNQHQLSACERVQQKAAIAIARLCSDLGVANTVAEMQGIQRLVQLCKDKRERNNSDSVLVACLAALRKIAAFRGNEDFKVLGAMELIETRLWDTFLAYSSKQESYV